MRRVLVEIAEDTARLIVVRGDQRSQGEAGLQITQRDQVIVIELPQLAEELMR